MKSFIVTTNGQTASKWLAQTLNLHPDVCCGHGTPRVPICFTYEREYKDEEITLALEDEIRRELTLEKIFNEYKDAFPKASWYGNVHMFNLRHLQHNIETKGLNHIQSLNVADLVRHPVSLIRSGTANMIAQSKFNPMRVNYLHQVMELNIDLYSEFSRKYKLNLQDVEVLAFLSSVMTLFSLDLNLKIEIPNDGKRIMMEEMTTNRGYFKDVFEFLTNGELECSEEYLDSVFSQKPVNPHHQNNVSQLVTKEEKIFEEWPKWKKEIFQEVLERTQVKQGYERLGYHFSTSILG